MSQESTDSSGPGSSDNGAAHSFFLLTRVNFTLSDVTQAMKSFMTGHCRYWCYAEEDAPTTGMKHVHFALATKRPHRMRALKNIFGNGCNVKWTRSADFHKFSTYAKKIE